VNGTSYGADGGETVIDTCVEPPQADASSTVLRTTVASLTALIGETLTSLGEGMEPPFAGRLF
jgi:hypothetical protein